MPFSFAKSRSSATFKESKSIASVFTASSFLTTGSAFTSSFLTTGSTFTSSGLATGSALAATGSL